MRPESWGRSRKRTKLKPNVGNCRANAARKCTKNVSITSPISFIALLYFTIDNTYRRWMWNGMRLRIVYGDLLKQSLQRQTVAERPKLSCIRDTFSVLGHTRAVIAVYILFHRVTRYILYRFKVTRSLHFASNLQYSPSHPLEAPYYAFCVRLSLNLFHFEPDPGLIQM